MIEKRKHSARSAWNKSSPLPRVKPPDARGADRVEILVVANRMEETEAIDSLRQRQLNQNRVDSRVVVQIPDHIEQRVGAGVGGRDTNRATLASEFRRSPLLILDILPRSRIVANQDRGERRRTSILVLEHVDIGTQIRHHIRAQQSGIHNDRSNSEYQWNCS